ncbi:MAG: DNA adenine methylase [Selenomonadaceae bacterium]|nr:DNA adenine methylase [Selenomonadaceae bacterium]
MIQSPLNYTGGKYKLLEQILPLFPRKIDRFFDFFCGGCNVGINSDCKEVFFIDHNEHLIALYQTFQNMDKSELLSWIYEIISHYGLSLVSRNGYEFYGCESNTGLGIYNRESFNQLRDDFNRSKNFDYRHYVMLYAIIVYAFNNQIRFNSAGKFNLPVGKRDFNSRMHEKLVTFVDRIKSKNYKFICQDFRDFPVENFSPNDFVYADPPYLITCATYNENGGWSDIGEGELLFFLDRINAGGIRFALSNVLSSKGKTNEILANWLEKNSDRYTAIHLNYNYSNSNYHRSNKNSESDEVLVVNYKIEKRQERLIELDI